MPAGRPTNYDPAYCERVIELGKEGKSQVQIAVALDVPRASLSDWAKAHPEFSAALTRAKECEQAWWEDTGQAGLTAEKFHGNVWSKSMSSRFRHDYTDRRDLDVRSGDGSMSPKGIDLSKLDTATLAKLADAIGDEDE